MAKVPKGLTDALRAAKTGEPIDLTGYHGTNDPGLATRNFDPSYIGQDTETDTVGHWFTVDPEHASQYADDPEDIPLIHGEFENPDEYAPAVYRAGVKLKNPAVVDIDDDLYDIHDELRKFKEQGHDGVIIRSAVPGSDTFVSFDSSNIDVGYGGRSPTQESVPEDMPGLTAALRRAEDAGFTTDVYHGSFNPNLTRFHGDLGVHVGTPDQASSRIGFSDYDIYDTPTRTLERGEGATIYPLKARIRNPLTMPDVGAWEDPIEVAAYLPHEVSRHLPDWTPEQMKAIDIEAIDTARGEGRSIPEQVAMFDDIRRALNKEGYDSIKYRNDYEGGGGAKGVHVFYAKKGDGEDDFNDAIWPDDPRYDALYREEYGKDYVEPPDLPDEEAYSYLVLDPEDLRYRNAEFLDTESDNLAGFTSGGKAKSSDDIPGLEYLKDTAERRVGVGEGAETGEEAKYVEPIARMLAQGWAGDVVGGTAGLGRLLRGEGVDEATKAIEFWREKLGYDPSGDEAALQGFQNIGEAIPQSVKEGAGYVGEKVGGAVDWVGERSPVAGAALHAAPDLLDLGSMLRGGRRIAKAADRQEIFAGPRTKGESQMRDLAYDRLKKGVPPEKVWGQLGWGMMPHSDPYYFRHAFMAQEIPDFDLDFKPGAIGPGGTPGGARILSPHPQRLDQILQGTTLSDVLRGVPSGINAQFDPSGSLNSGSWDSGNTMINLAEYSNPDMLRSGLIHELGHGAQTKSNFPRGGSPNEWGYATHLANERKAEEDIRRVAKSLGLEDPKNPQPIPTIIDKMRNTPGFDPVNRQILDQRYLDYVSSAAKRQEAYQNYQKIHGEAMTRLGQYRRNLQAPSRRKAERYPFAEDYFRKATGFGPQDLIIR